VSAIFWGILWLNRRAACAFDTEIAQIDAAEAVAEPE